jgi:hypothetical protein
VVGLVLQAERDIIQATAKVPGQAPDAELDSAARSYFRRHALSRVMKGRQLTARVVHMDEQTGNVVLAGDWLQPMQALICAVQQYSHNDDANIRLSFPLPNFISSAACMWLQGGLLSCLALCVPCWLKLYG